VLFCPRNTAAHLHHARADLRPCPVNLYHRPRSWFDLFAKDEAAEVVEAWLKMAQRQEESWNERRKQWEREAARDD
jgi:hypothetical protein